MWCTSVDLTGSLQPYPDTPQFPKILESSTIQQGFTVQSHGYGSQCTSESIHQNSIKL